jgi:hypothetical protein
MDTAGVAEADGMCTAPRHQAVLLDPVTSARPAASWQYAPRPGQRGLRRDAAFCPAAAARLAKKLRPRPRRDRRPTAIGAVHRGSRYAVASSPGAR